MPRERASESPDAGDRLWRRIKNLETISQSLTTWYGFWNLKKILSCELNVISSKKTKLARLQWGYDSTVLPCCWMLRWLANSRSIQISGAPAIFFRACLRGGNGEGCSDGRLAHQSYKRPTKETSFHLIPASCTGRGLFFAWDSSVTLISSD